MALFVMSGLWGRLKVKEGQALLVSSAQSKLDGTVWTDVDDSRVFKVLDLEDIEKTFSAYQRQQVEGAAADWPGGDTPPSRHQHVKSHSVLHQYFPHCFFSFAIVTLTHVSRLVGGASMSRSLAFSLKHQTLLKPTRARFIKTTLKPNRR